MRIMLCALLMGMAFAASAQEVKPDARSAAAAAFAKDLAALQMDVRQQGVLMAQAQGQYTTAEYSSRVQELLDATVRKAQALAANWGKDPYVQVDGFTIALGLTGPEVSVSFRLK